MDGRELIELILRNRAEDAEIEIDLGGEDVLLPYNLGVTTMERGKPVHAYLWVLKGRKEGA